MTTRSRRNLRAASEESGQRGRSFFVQYLPAWFLLGIVAIIIFPQVVAFAFNAVGKVPAIIGDIFRHRPSGVIAPLFTDQVEYWSDDIVRWAAEYDLDPNLLATVMQIESCGHPTVSSYAGAQGLFQVMPFHFEIGQDQLDPDTNATAGAKFLYQCLGWANGDPNMAMACYNGGPSVLGKNSIYWSDQTRRYYVWGSGIYGDAVNNRVSSYTLDEWLKAGGSNLCRSASSTLGLS